MEVFFCVQDKKMTKAQALFNDYLKSLEELDSIKDIYEYEKQFVALHE